MATGRTHLKHSRVYIDGYDMSGYTRTFGPLSTEWEEGDATVLTDEIKNVMLNKPNITCSAFNGVFDTTAASGLHPVMNTSGTKRTVMHFLGIRGVPAAGDPAFCGQWLQNGYHPEVNDPVVYVSIPWGQWAYDAGSLAYGKAWGHVLHAKGAETAANTTTGGGGDIDNGAQTTAGGIFVYQVFSGDGTATLSVDDSADDSIYSALSGATSGELDCSSPQHGMVALGTSATVRRYLRWQLSLNTATTVTFAGAFIRG